MAVESKPRRSDPRPAGMRLPLGRAALALAVAIVLGAAAYLRFRGLGHAPMWGDQSLILGIALRWVRGGPLPLAGIKSSAGIMNPPLAEYLLALPLLVKQAVLPAVVFNALLGLLSVGLCYYFVTRLAGPRTALIATILFATNPWAVHYARFFWNQNFVPVFSTLLVGSLLLYFTVARRPALLALSFLWLAAVIQLHLAGLPLIGVVALIFVLFYRRLDVRALAAGAALFVLSFLPYLYYMKLTHFADLKALVGTLGGKSIHFNIAPFLLIRDLVSGHGLVESYGAWQAAVWPWFRLAGFEGWLLVAALVYAAGYMLLRGRRDLFRKDPAPTSAAFTILLVWIAVPALFYLRHTVYLQNYYFIYLFPALFIVIGLAADHLLKALEGLAARQGRFVGWARYGGTAVVLVPVLAIAGWQFELSQVRMDLLDRGVLYERQAQDIDSLVAAARRALADRPGAGLIVISEGSTAETSPFGILADFLAPADVRYVQDGSGLIIPEGGAVYVDTTGSGWLQGCLGQSPGPVLEEVKAGEDTWRLYATPAGAAPASAQGEPVGTWAGGVELLDCRVEGNLVPGGAAEVTETWRATQPSDARVYHFFNHLVYQADDSLVSQQDGPGVHSLYWRAGDVFVTRFAIPIPADAPQGQYVLRVGLYDLWTSVRMPLAGGGDALDAASLEVGAAP